MLCFDQCVALQSSKGEVAALFGQVRFTPSKQTRGGATGMSERCQSRRMVSKQCLPLSNSGSESMIVGSLLIFV